ncbi:hypothetical protein G9A89_020875 [Geosiphon pyriformis]|nr:hypothetical protein G9A89_020875 [Geosiphon pyriformis]
MKPILKVQNLDKLLKEFSQNAWQNYELWAFFQLCVSVQKYNIDKQTLFLYLQNGKNMKPNNSPVENCLLGCFYSWGIGTEHDFKKAYDCFKSAADQGNPIGNRFLGYAHIHGRAALKDVHMAIRFHRKVLKNGKDPETVEFFKRIFVPR